MDQLLALQKEHPRSRCEDALLTLCATLHGDIQALQLHVASLEVRLARQSTAQRQSPASDE